MLNARQARWLGLIIEFSFEIKYIKGKEKKLVDALSRSMLVTQVATISTYKIDIKERIKERIKEALLQDEHCR